MKEKILAEINHNGKRIKIWLSDYRHGDQNVINVAIGNVIIMSENIQQEF